MASASKPDQPARGQSGRYTVTYNDDDLWQAVADVARVARSDDPASCSQRAFDECRVLAGHPGLPTARWICRRLAPEHLDFRPWPDLLALACDPDRDPRNAETRRRRSVTPELISAQRISYALNVVARHEGVRTLAPFRYSGGRARLIEADRAWRHGGAIEATLPTAKAIETAVERLTNGEVAEAARWDYALALAGLEPRHVHEWPQGVPLVEAVELFIEKTGWLCTSGELQRFAFDLNFALSNGSYRDAYAEVQRRRKEAGLELARAAPTGTTVSYETSPDGVPGWPKHLHGDWTFMECIEALRSYDAALAANDRRTRDRYRLWASLHRDRPAVETFDRWGGFRTMLRLSKTPDPVAPANDVESGAAGRPAVRHEWVATRRGYSEKSVLTGLLSPESRSKGLATRQARLRERFSLQPLVRAGLLLPGERVVYPGQHGGRKLLGGAVVSADGSGLVIAGHDQVVSVNEAARIIKGNRDAVDGLERWKVNRLTKWIALSALQQALDAGQAKRLIRLAPIDQPLGVVDKSTAGLAAEQQARSSRPRPRPRTAKEALALLLQTGLLDTEDILLYRTREHGVLTLRIAPDESGVLVDGDPQPTTITIAEGRLTGKFAAGVRRWKVERFGTMFLLADLLPIADALAAREHVE
jgi:hypothetical protein